MKMFCKFGNVETVRFRGAARPDMNTTKKIAVIKRAIHENRHNISAYVRFKERSDAEKAAAATNGVKVMQSPLTEVDNVTHTNQLSRLSLSTQTSLVPSFCRMATMC